MDFRILGPLEVAEDGRPVDLGGTKQRALLAFLALNANRVVARDQLVEALWDDEPPETAGKALQVYVSQLRKLLGRERLETTPQGYLLRLEPDELDLARFQRLHESERPTEALALWRGDPLADLAGQRFAQGEIARLQELRLACLEQRIEQDLARGRHAELVGELDALAREHPLREHLRAQLMLAFYRAGRQAEALGSYQAARNALIDELGIEPGRALRELHQQILQQDPALDFPSRNPPERWRATTVPSRAPPRLGEMRKTVTVVFCDLAGSTGLGERLDPESLRALMARWYSAMRGPIERHGGTVEKFIGDAVMAVFGVPHVHEDDAMRAVLAALEMQTAVDRLNDEGNGTVVLRIRVGINSGEVVTGDTSDSLVTGDAVNTAKRLEEAAAPGEILLGAATRSMVANATELEAVPPVAARGKSGFVDAWRVVTAIPGAAPFARRLDAPLVGRETELAFLRKSLDTVASENRCRVVTVYGDAGIGKSRLAAEFLTRFGEHARSLTARCLPYGDGITFLPLIELVHSLGGDEAIVTAVGSEPDGALIVERIGGAIGTTSDPASTEETFWAIRRLFETLARDRPLVVCLEDVHWAEPTFLDLLEYVAGWSKVAPILLLCVARPELLEARPRWGGEALMLGALSTAESQQLLDALAEEWPLAPDHRAQVAEAADGNPLFLEQLVAMLAERGADSGLPPTIEALLAARLDSLEPVERGVLERASVVGKEFWRGAVAELSPAGERTGVSAALLSLVRKGLVSPEESTFLGDDGFSFRHALIRDAAYAAVPKAVRADVHEGFAGWLERNAGEEEIIGYHLEQAYRYRAGLGVRDDRLAARAGELLGGAGSRASNRGDAAASLTLLRRSLELLPASHPRRAELLRMLSDAYWVDGDIDAAASTLNESIEAARAEGDTLIEWYGLLELAARGAAAHGDTDALVRTAESAATVFADLGDDLGLARALRRLGLVAHTERRYADAAAAFERAVAHAQASGDQQEHARSADGLCTALLFGPAHVPEAIARAEAILADAGHNAVLRAHVSTSLAGLLAMRGDFDGARRLYGEAGAVYDELGLRLPWVGWTEIVAHVELLAGDTAAARRALEGSQAVLSAAGSDGLGSLRAYHAALLALVAAMDGDLSEAEHLLELCELPADELDADTVARMSATQALVAGNREDAVRLARAAVTAAERTDDLNLQGAMRLTLARVTDDPHEAETARRLFESKGNVAATAVIGLSSYRP
jgi:class 3 adenylate cyclase/DNA-binding SARP family transcriptional activator